MKVKAEIVGVGGGARGHMKDTVTVSIDFGDITHTISNMYNVLATDNIK